MRQLLHRFGLRFAVLSVVALLVAQVGAMAHAYSHDAGATSAVHRSGGAGHDPCSDCLGYAASLSLGGAPCSLPFSLPQGPVALAGVIPDSPYHRSPTLAFRSRAPPSPI